MSGSDIDRHVRQVVGIATLRRLRHMVDSDNAGEAQEAKWAKRLGVLFTLLAIVFVVGLAIDLYTR